MFGIAACLCFPRAPTPTCDKINFSGTRTDTFWLRAGKEKLRSRKEVHCQRNGFIFSSHFRQSCILINALRAFSIFNMNKINVTQNLSAAPPQIFPSAYNYY